MLGLHTLSLCYRASIGSCALLCDTLHPDTANMILLQSEVILGYHQTLLDPCQLFLHSGCEGELKAPNEI